MKEKILLELNKKYSGQATSKFLESLAERLAEKVEKESDIEGVINELENSPIRIGDLQSEGDRRAMELQTKFTKTKADIEAEKAEIKAELEGLKKKSPGPAKDDDKITELENRLAAFEQKEIEREIRNTLSERAKAKNIPPALYKNISIKSVDEVDGIVADLEKEAQEIKQAWINEGVVGKAPSKPDGKPGDNEQIKSDIETFSKNIR